MQQGVQIAAERYDWVRTKNDDDEMTEAGGTRRSYFVRLLRSLVSCSEIEIMRHRLLDIVIGSRAAAVAIIFHYYCYRFRSTSLHLSPFLPPPRPPRSIDDVTDVVAPGQRIETTRVNLTFHLIPECILRDYADDHRAIR